ncbi:MAG: RNA-directed DNA polymerase [Limisphaerales bacterium]
MNTSKAAAQLAKWIAVDIEDAQVSATSESPSSQYRLLLEAIRQVINGEVEGGDAAKLLGIAQAILAGSYPLLAEPVAIEVIEGIMAFSSRETSLEIRERAFTVAALILNRVRGALASLPDSTVDLVSSALSRAGSSREKSVLSAMDRHIKSAAVRLSRARSRGGRNFDLPSLDVSTAAKNVREDIEGDWYHDPWGWPEIEWLGQEHPQEVLERLRTDGCGWVVPIDVSKPGGGVRPGLLLNPLDRLAFQSLVDELSVEAAGHLPAWVYGWRLSRSKQSKGAYEPNKREWSAFSGRVASLCKSFPFTAHLDIQSFFATVDTPLLLSQLGRRYRKVGVLDRLEAYFQEWHLCQNGLGIPQRSLASSILAHALLGPVDVFLDRMSKGGQSGTFVASRWMDDIWLHSNNKKDLESCLTEVEGLLAQLRLSLNAEKTEVFESQYADKFVQLVDIYEEEVEEEDPSLLLRQLLDRTEGAPGFHIGFEVSKILKIGDFRVLAEISPDEWLRMKHLGSRFARAFRVSGDWRRLADAYLDFARSHPSMENLSVVAWAEMFPNKPEGEVQKIQEFFSGHIGDEPQRLLTPLAAQRVAAWSSRFGPGKLADLEMLTAYREEDDVFRLRGVCLAALQAGIPKDLVIGALSRDDDNLVADYLKDRNYHAPALSARFQAS